MTCQPLWVILCRLPEKGRKEIEEIVKEMKERDREERGTGMKVKKQKKLEMCQYDTDASTLGHPHPHAGILQKMKLKKGAITLIIIGRFYPKSNLAYIL